MAKEEPLGHFAIAPLVLYAISKASKNEELKETFERVKEEYKAKQIAGSHKYAKIL